MPAATYEIEVNLSKEQVWEKLCDFSAAAHYVPGLTRVEINTELQSGMGASRTVYQGKMGLSETVIEWQEGEGFTLRLHRGDKGPVPPLSAGWFDYGVVERDGKVYLSNAMRYEVGLGFFGRWLDKLAIGKVVANAVRDSTIAQKLYYETGEDVTPDRLKAAKKELGIA